MSGKDKIESGAPKGIKHTLSENKKLEDMATQKIPNRTQEHFQKTLGEKEREQDTTQKSFLNRMSTIFKHMLSKEESKVGVQPGKRAEVDLPDGDEDIDHRKDIDDKDKKDIDKDKKDRKDIDDKDKKDIHDKDKKDIDKKDRKDIDDKDKKDIHDKKGAGKKEEGSETARKEGALTATDKVVVQQLGDTIIKGMVNFATEARPDVGKGDRVATVNAAMEVISSMAVSKGEHGQDRMCQVTIGKESILAGTDIRVFEKGGELQFQFFVKTDAAANLMQQQSAVQDLQNFLQTQLKQTNINISVNDERGEQGGGGQGGGDQGGGGQGEGGQQQGQSQEQDQSRPGPFSQPNE